MSVYDTDVKPLPYRPLPTEHEVRADPSEVPTPSTLPFTHPRGNECVDHGPDPLELPILSTEHSPELHHLGVDVTRSLALVRHTDRTGVVP